MLLNVLEVGTNTLSKIDQKMSSTSEGLLASIFEGFWWILEPSWDPRSSQNGRATASKNRAILIRSWLAGRRPAVLGVCLASPPWRPPICARSLPKTYGSGRRGKREEGRRKKGRKEEGKKREEGQERREKYRGSDTPGAQGPANFEN